MEAAIASHSNTVLAAETAEATNTRGTVRGVPARVLRLEALLVLVVSVVAYRALGGHWGLFAALFLVPDVSMLGYLVDRRVGAIAYNVGHSYVTPGVLAALGLAFHLPAALLMALIWTAHVGFDRALGYGLKYATHFGDTHLAILRRA